MTRGRAARVVLIALAATLGACASPWDAYRAAVRDAVTIEADEVSDTLTPIRPDQPGQVWRTSPHDGRPQVKVVTWTSARYCTGPGPPSTLPAEAFVWVSVCPEIREFGRSLHLSGDALALRLKQRLGLPPDADKTCFVEYWVDPDDLFRPALDPRISTTTVDPGGARDVPNPYAAFLVQQTITAYGADPPGYPWTRLGYTFDWSYRGGGPDGEWGGSEYVIRGGATVEVAGVFATDTYCSGR